VVQVREAHVQGARCNRYRVCKRDVQQVLLLLLLLLWHVDID